MSSLNTSELKEKKSETLLLKKIMTSPSKDKDSVWKYQWVFYLKEGLSGGLEMLFIVRI